MLPAIDLSVHLLDLDNSGYDRSVSQLVLRFKHIYIYIYQSLSPRTSAYLISAGAILLEICNLGETEFRLKDSNVLKKL